MTFFPDADPERALLGELLKQGRLPLLPLEIDKLLSPELFSDGYRFTARAILDMGRRTGHCDVVHVHEEMIRHGAGLNTVQVLGALAEAAPVGEVDVASLIRLLHERNGLEAGAEHAATEPEHLTDLGNALRFVRIHREDVRFCHPWGRWLIWTGTHWQVDETGEIARRAKQTVRSIYADAESCEDKDRRQALARHATRSEAEGKLKAMLALAESEPGIPVVPDELDRDPWALNVLDGTLDLRTGELRPHRKADLITKVIPVAYELEAACPTWLAFLDRIFDGNDRLIAFVQRAIGYSLTGDTSEQCLFLCYGRGENGKTTKLQTILGLMGDYARKTPTETLMVRRGESIPNDVARLRGARFVAAVEAEEGRRLAESLVKELTGGDTIAARFMRAEWFEFLPQFKIWLATNHKPRIIGTDRAIWRRIRLIPFGVRIPKTEQDRRLGEKLREEWPGILAWAVQGCLAWQRHGLDEPDEVTRATEEYRAEQDLIGAFLAECCHEDPNASALARDLYGAYRAWAEENGERPTTQKDFGTRLAERSFSRVRGTGNVKKWLGVGLLEK